MWIESCRFHVFEEVDDSPIFTLSSSCSDVAGNSFFVNLTPTDGELKIIAYIVRPICISSDFVRSFLKIIFFSHLVSLGKVSFILVFHGKDMAYKESIQLVKQN